MPLPFLLRRSGKAERAFPPEPPESLVLYGCAVPETAQSIAGRSGGAGHFRTAPPEVGKPRGLFRQSLPGALLYVSPSRKPHGSLPGHWRFCATQPEVGKLSGLFRQSRWRHLLYGSPFRKLRSPSPGRCGGTGASAPHSREWKPCHKRKKRRKFPPLF